MVLCNCSTHFLHGSGQKNTSLPPHFYPHKDANTWGCLTTTSWFSAKLKKESLVSFFLLALPWNTQRPPPPLAAFCADDDGWFKLLIKLKIKGDFWRIFIDSWSQITSLSLLMFCPFPKFPKSVLVGLILPNFSFCFLCFVCLFFLNPNPDRITDWFSSGGTVTAWSSSRFIWWYVAF